MSGQLQLNLAHDRRRPNMSALPWDIHGCILPLVVDTADLSRYMRTCSTIYFLGIPKLLKNVRFPSPSRSLLHLQSFCHFALNHNPQRIHLLRELHLPELSQLDDEASASSIQEEVVDMLSRVILGAKHLETLHIVGFDEDYLSFDSVLFRAITSNTNLHTVDVLVTKMTETALLRALPHSIRKVVIRFEFRFVAEEDLTALDPTSLLSGLAYSLEELHIIYPPEGMDIAVTDGCRFFHVHSFVMVSPDFGNLHAEDLAYTFPKLKTLILRGDMDAGESEMAREENQEHTEYEDMAWQHLERLRCDNGPTYALAFRCTVQHWEGIHLPELIVRPEVKFHANLKDLRPDYLDVTLFIPDFEDEDEMLAVFPSDQSSVTHLNIEVLSPFEPFDRHAPSDEEPPHSNMRWVKWLGESICNLKSLVVLSIRCCFEHQYGRSLTLNHDRTLRDNLDRMVGTLFATLAGLSHIYFQFNLAPDLDVGWKRPVGGQSTAEELSEDDAWEVMKASPFAEKLCSRLIVE
ncbi:hypothetical protein EIP91_004544 [Steccherinum ochraceum]|uniref:F-box domain-containing protein n=1 Tax=Steccherinum ochraceum TaxID=92696 RepID=A0A4R0R9C7_9APHY|nr:hypothetical protein EIP91_004544 [Steccherinum ochraceum]